MVVGGSGRIRFDDRPRARRARRRRRAHCRLDGQDDPPAKPMPASGRRPRSCARPSRSMAPAGARRCASALSASTAAFINGKRVGDDQLTPGWTSYWTACRYQTYDVGDLLKAGENTIDIWLGDGWYRSQMMWPRNQILNTWGERDRRHRRAARRAGKVAARHRRRAGRAARCRSSSAASISARSTTRAQRAQPADRRQRASSAASTQSTLIPHEINGVKELDAARRSSAQLHRCRGPHGLRFRPEHRRLCRLHRRGRARRARSSSSTPRSLDHDGQFDNAQLSAPPRRASSTSSRAAATESYRPTFTFFGFRYARVTIEGKARITAIEIDPDQLGDHADRRRSPRRNALVNRLVAEHDLVAARRTSSRCRPTARSATSASAGPATRRSSRATACYLARQPRLPAQVCCAT